MGNKSKRRQACAAVTDAWGLACGSKCVDAGYSGVKKDRRFRAISAKPAIDGEEMLRRRRARRAARKNQRF